MRLLRTPPVKWDKAAQKINESDVQEIVSVLEHMATRAARLAEYLDTRCGGTGCGKQSHEDSVKAANKKLVEVRRAIGYSYPQAGVFTF